MKYVILNRTLIPETQACIPISDRGFRYGDGLFETVRVLHGQMWRSAWHMERLSKGAHTLKIACDSQCILEDCAKLIEKNALQDGLLRIQLTRGISGRGYLPAPNATPNVVIETMERPAPPESSVVLCISAYEKISPKALPVQAKLCQGLNSTLARLHAEEKQCFDAVLLNASGHVCETSSANIFWLKKDTLYTPALECGVLEGSMRAAILEATSYATQEVTASVDALLDADAVCVCNISWGVVPVSRVVPYAMEWDSKKLAKALAESVAKHHFNC